jgi:hypothetical protein
MPDPVDTQLLDAVSAANPASIADVVAIMQRIDSILPVTDGLKWFNLLYLMVTQQVNAPPGGWEDAAWLTRLDVEFAGYYFAAIASTLAGSGTTPSAWEALFEARSRTDVDRIQFALAGMNAHINHDLAQVLVGVDAELGVTPTVPSPEHDDYQHVNGLLEQVLPAALQFLASDTLGVLAQDSGKIGQLLAIWNVSAARDLAWEFADQLRSLVGPARTVAIAAQDQLTGVIGRSLLLPIQSKVTGPPVVASS